MAVVFYLFCGLFVSSLFGEPLAATGCKGNRIAKVLQQVDWEELAGELDIEVGTRNTISADCKMSTAIAVCYRRGLVQYYCDSTALELEQVVENIAQALERMEKNSQAKTLRKDFGLTAESSTPTSQPPPGTSTASSTSGGSSAKDPGQSQVPEPPPFYHTLVQNWTDLSTREIILGGAVTAVAGLLAIRVYCKKKPKKPKSPSPSPPRSPSPPPSSPDPGLPEVDSLKEPIFGERVDSRKLVVIKYVKHNKQKELRIKEKIALHWKNLARLLDFEEAAIENIHAEARGRDVEATDSMLSKWMAQDTKFTWGKLIRKMRDVVGLNVPAEDLAYALRNIAE